MLDEILVKGTDGKWYILRGEELLPYGEHGTRGMEHGAGAKELPKGVTEAEYARFEVAREPKVSEVAKVSFAASGSSASFAASHESHPLTRELEELIDRVVVEVAREPKVPEVAKVLEDTVLQKRFRSIVSARLRDVRDSVETKEMLARDQKVGGLGLGMEHGARIMEHIEKAFAEFQAKWKTEEAKRKEEWKKKQREQQVQQEQLEKEKEQGELEERYRRLTAQVPKVATEPKVAKVVEAPKLPPTPKTTRVSETPKTSVTSATFATSATLPRSGKITDIRPVPKLVGPVEELAGIMLQDFRRLGTPAQATAKILGKIDLLGKQSLARRGEGIKAWMGCEVNRLYQQGVRKALDEGRAVAELLAHELTQGKPSLTEAEFDAIMELNKGLRNM